jgi:hypothetical protein
MRGPRSFTRHLAGVAFARHLAGVALALTACGSEPKTPEAALQRLLDAATRGDAAAFRAAFPSREELAELFDCPPDLDLTARYDGLSDEFVAWRNARPTLAGGLAASAKTAVAPGDDLGGCKARRAMTLYRAEVRLVEGGSDRSYAMRFVDLGERVRVLAF